MKIIISTDFSETPGARYKHEGSFSGEEFREKLLAPAFIECRKRKEKLIIDLDGGYGYPTSFLEEAFGGMARMYGKRKVNDILEFVSEDEPSLVDEIRNYISAAEGDENNE